MKFSKILLSLLLMGCCTCVRAQENPVNLSGAWVGELVQNYHPRNLYDKPFPLSMNLRQTGIFIRGTAYVSFRDQYVELELSGHQLPNGSFYLMETKILRSSDLAAYRAAWCYKGYELRLSYTEEGLQLAGPWWGETEEKQVCVPGAVTLRKAKPRA